MPKRKFSGRTPFPKRRRRKYGRRRKYTRRRRYTMYKRMGNKNVFNTILRGSESIVNNSAVAITPFSVVFRLADCINYTTYTTLFDQYRINKVVFTATPVKTQVVNRPYDDSTTAGEVLAIPRMTMVIDRDDNDLVTTFDQIYQRPNARTVLATKKQTYVFKPTKLGMVYKTATTTGYKVDWSREFVDCGDNDIPHYGLKGCIEAATPAQAFTYRLETKFYISFKNRKL